MPRIGDGEMNRSDCTVICGCWKTMPSAPPRPLNEATEDEDEDKDDEDCTVRAGAML